MKVKKNIQILIFFISSLVFTVYSSCADSSVKRQNNEPTKSVLELEQNSDTIAKLESVSDSTLYFSTLELKSSKRLNSTSFPLKTVGYDGEIYDNMEDVIQLRKNGVFDIVIDENLDGDYPIYYLCVVKKNIFDIKKGLNITPRWDDLDDRGDYRNIYFEISSDYLIRIDTEEKTDGEIKKYTNNYRINNNGDFYEVKE